MEQPRSFFQGLISDKWSYFVCVCVWRPSGWPILTSFDMNKQRGRDGFSKRIVKNGQSIVIGRTLPVFICFRKPRGDDPFFFFELKVKWEEICFQFGDFNWSFYWLALFRSNTMINYTGNKLTRSFHSIRHIRQSTSSDCGRLRLVLSHCCRF